MLGSGVLGDSVGVMLINTQVVGYLLAGMIVLFVSARWLSLSYKQTAELQPE